jgi:cytochrome c peroxidase
MAQMRKSAAKPAATMKKSAAKPAATKAKSKPSTIQQVAKRFGVTAREARDIATAIGTYGTLKFDPDSKYDRYSTQKIEKAKAVKNIKKQVSETITAARTGRKGTTSGVATFSDGEVPYTYAKGKKRK